MCLILKSSIDGKTPSLSKASSSITDTIIVSKTFSDLLSKMTFKLQTWSDLVNLQKVWCGLTNVFENTEVVILKQIQPLKMYLKIPRKNSVKSIEMCSAYI